MSLATFRQRKVYEQAAARYSALLANTRDPSRRQMLEEMIARELAAAAKLELLPSSSVNDERDLRA
jgi:hypothetical protein